MDVSAILMPIVERFWWVLPVFLLFSFLQSPMFKGMLGEFLVNLAARLRLDKSEYKVVKNVTLPTDDGTTQIDHIILSRFGIFVVETKYFRGWIFGTPRQKTWTQKIYRKSFKFQNPLRQNYKHVKTLQGLLGLSDDIVHSIVVFIGDSKFKTPMPENVCYGGRYVDYIRSFTIPKLTQAEVENIAQRIEEGRLARSLKTNREHVKHVKKLVEAKQASAEPVPMPVPSAAPAPAPTPNVTCPKCLSSMVLRVIKTGQHQGRKFWGCSQYPKCRGVKLPQPSP